MNKDVLIMICIWIIAISAAMLFIPRKRWAEAIFVYMLGNSLMWINALIHLNYGLISFPVREFPKATDLSATLDYFSYPLVIVLYVLYEPNKRWRARLLHLIIYVSGLIVFDVLLERFTNLVKYLNYAWYWTWIDFFILFLSIRLIKKWFFRGDARVA